MASLVSSSYGRLHKLVPLLPVYEGKLLSYILGSSSNDDDNEGSRNSNINISTYKQSLYDILTIYESNENDNTFAMFKSSVLQILIEFSLYISTLIYNTTFENLSVDDGKKISQTFIQGGKKTSELGLTYGEITFNSFAAVLEYCHPMDGKVFVDLGSGTGKALIIASLLFGTKLKHVHGIELIPGLYESSVVSINKYYDIMKQQFPEMYDCIKGCKITAEEGDILQYGKDDNNDDNKNNVDIDDITQKYDWTKADIVLCNSTCFPSKLMIDLAKCAEKMKRGFYLLSFLYQSYLTNINA